MGVRILNRVTRIVIPLVRMVWKARMMEIRKVRVVRAVTTKFDLKCIKIKINKLGLSCAKLRSSFHFSGLD